jgi:adenylate cyclase class IV
MEQKEEIEKEVKFSVADISSTLKNIRKIAKFSRAEYIRDAIYGMEGEKKKIRLRMVDNFKDIHIEAIYKYKIDCDNGIKNEIEKTIYKGENIEEAIKFIESRGDFKEENSYEKTRAVFIAKNGEITLDIYPYGVWVEVESSNLEDIWDISEKIGYKKSDAITLNADELYEEWCHKNKTDILWDVRFGFPDMENNIYEKINEE